MTADAVRAGPPAVAPVSTQSPHVHQTACTAARFPEVAVAVPRTRTSPARHGSGHPRSATAVADPRDDRACSPGDRATADLARTSPCPAAYLRGQGPRLAVPVYSARMHSRKGTA